MNHQDTDIRPFETCEIMGVNIAVTDMESCVRLISDNVDKWRGSYICVSNVHTTVMSYKDEAYRNIQNNAVMALPDGGPLSAVSRQKGYAAAQRVTGPDLMQHLLRGEGGNAFRHYFYGATEETLEILSKKLKEKYPSAQVVGMFSPPFRDIAEQEDEAIINMINEAKPDFVWVGLGAPKQEIWMAAHKDRINAVMIGVGAAFDFEAGRIKRAPAWMQKCSLEWLYRLMQDPKRLFKRYFVTNVQFILWLFAEKMRSDK
jgi:N-acetylglucosaminyldiphosphoundecaprenol N-acetyl-beta-D-mannosaminyltransferase